MSDARWEAYVNYSSDLLDREPRGRLNAYVARCNSCGEYAQVERRDEDPSAWNSPSVYLCGKCVVGYDAFHKGMSA